VAIAEGRHVDVLEMDAASRTGVGDIREIIDSVRYRAASARYKIYIIDEVHMLSTSAFNALLKTLEEPPSHVKFIFATTEIRKVPVTVLSRCQRFDLRRIEPEVMMAHLARLAAAEGARVSGDALALIARAAEGSARDAVSLLDQAIAHGRGETGVDEVRAMLGLADRGRVLDLFDLVMQGDAAGALAELGGQYADGAEPMAVLRDLAEITHWISVIKITPAAAEDPTIGPHERSRGLQMAERLPMRALTRAWQMLLAALEEASRAPAPMQAAEMTLIRLTHVSDLPSPEELVRKLQDAPAPSPSSAPGVGGAARSTPASTPPASAPSPPPAAREERQDPGPRRPTMQGAGAPAAALAAAPETALARYARFEQVVDLIRQRRDVRLLVEVETTLRLAAYAPGRIEFEPAPHAPADLAQRLGARLQSWTGVRWGVSVVGTGGAPTIAETRDAEFESRKAAARANPIVGSILAAFPDAEITEIRAPEPVAADPAPADDEEWDPFED
jgi:DNA polymerase-3 subunit gamma/tau